MSKENLGELRNLSTQELEHKKGALQRELFDLRQKRAGGTLEKPHFFKKLRRQVAQINTIEKEKARVPNR